MSVAAIRGAVRAALTGIASTAAYGPKIDDRAVDLGNAVESLPVSALPLALVACSGGADSLALAGAAAFVGPRAGWRVGVVSVDHGLQEGSGLRARQVVEWAETVGLSPAEVVTVSVGSSGGPEAAARDARYGALVEVAQRHSASAVLLGHTEDDQAETVLLALARGAGPRGIAGMPAVQERDGVVFVRPLLGISRAVCRSACAAMGLSVWDDPHNVDPSFARARVRSDVMPTLVSSLGADVVPNLARTASLVAADAEYLDELASVAFGQCLVDGGLEVKALAELPAPLRSRVLHAWVTSLGVPRASLSYRHIAALDALVTAWHGQGSTQLPGNISVGREANRLVSL